MDDLEMCLAEVRKRTECHLFDDVEMVEQSQIVDRALEGLRSLGASSIARQLKKTPSLTHSKYADFAICSSYWVMKVRNGFFANCRSDTESVMNERKRATKTIEKARKTIHQLERAIAAIDSARQEFPLAHDGGDDYAVMFGRWHSMTEQLYQDIQLQNTLIAECEEYKGYFSTHAEQVALITNKNWSLVVEGGVVSQISHQVTTSPAPSDRYAWGFLTGRPRAFSLFIALTYAITSPT